jgi:hypothetical protein
MQITSKQPTDPSDRQSAPKHKRIAYHSFLSFAVIYPVYEVTDATKRTTIVNQLIDLALLVVLSWLILLEGYVNRRFFQDKQGVT